MAGNPQPGYGTSYNMLYHQQQTQHVSPERPRTAGSGRSPQFQNFSRAQTPHRDVRHRNDGNGVPEQRGNGGWSEKSLGKEQNGATPYVRTYIGTGGDLNLSSQAVGLAQPYLTSPHSQYKKPQYDRHQYDEQYRMSGRTPVMQPPQISPHELPTEPVFDREPIEGDPPYYNNTSANRINPQDNRARPPLEPSVASARTTDHQGGEAPMPTRRHDYAEMYRQELFQGAGGPTTGGFEAGFSQSRAGHDRAQKQSAWPHQGQGQKPIQQRILARPPSPQSLSWDNPFPVFGAKNKNAAASDGLSLNNPMSRMRIDNSHIDPTAQRPPTASGKSSHISSQVGPRRIDEVGVQPTSSPTSRRPSDHQLELRPIMPPPRTPIHQTFRGARALEGRHSEDTRVRPSFESTTRSDSDNRRSRTMPSNISSVAREFGSHREYGDHHSRPELGSNAGHYGSESVGRREIRPANNVSPAMANQPPMASRETGKATGSGELPTKGPSPYPHHSAHNSLGEVYDSYYHASAYDQQIHPPQNPRQRAESFDEDMPNFDAVPAARLGHRRGMTIDEHLQPQLSIPISHQPQDEGRQDRSATSQQHVHMAGQFNRSKSQPNFKEQRSREAQVNDGFVFDLPGDAPPLPLTSPQRTNFAHLDNIPAGYSGDIDHMTGQQGRLGDAQRGVPGAAHSNGRAMLNESYQKAFQGGPNPESYRFPPLQNEATPQAPRTAPARMATPGNPVSPISKPLNHPSSADNLPLHPAPVRPGLMQSTSFQSAPPRPVGQFNKGPSSLHRREPIPMQGASMSSNPDQLSNPVTYDELEQLRQAVKAKPSDQKMQLLFAKKLVEASNVLADDGGRADPKTKIKNREKYILDAHKIVKKLVSGHSPDATFYLADCYSCGLLGLEADPKEAFILYQTAAKAGHAQAAYRAAVCYEMGLEDGGGTRRDPHKAFQWYQRAATLGDTPAMYKLGVIQLKGLLGQQRNPQEALKWLKRAAEQANEENPHALHELGLLYEGAGPKSLVQQDEEYSKQLFMQAANLGYKFSQFRLGCAYEYGLKGCPIDPRQSIAWYSKAAVQEEHQSELALSGWYLTGSEGVLLQSDTEAYLWARKAAQAGLAKAEYAMGYFTEVGIGVPANLEDAKRWYWRSASQNFPKARDRLEALRKGGATMEKSRVSRSAIRKQTEGECTIM